jgi:hypothetical protein
VPGASLAEVLARPPLTDHEAAVNEVLLVLKKLKTTMKKVARLEHRTYPELLVSCKDALFDHLTN